MYSSTLKDFTLEEIESFGWKPIGDTPYVDSIYEEGIRVPLFVATRDEKTYLIGGNRRLLSFIKARQQAIDDGTIENRPWLNTVKCLVYDDVPLTTQTAWAIADNEERSDNPIHTFLVMQAAQRAGDWDEVNRLNRLHASKEKQLRRLGELNPELFALALSGQMSKTVTLEAAKLGARQSLLLEVAKQKGDKPITISDIKAVKRAGATATLAALPLADFQNVAIADVTEFEWLVLTEEVKQYLLQHNSIFESGTLATIEKYGSNGTIYHIFRM